MKHILSAAELLSCSRAERLEDDVTFPELWLWSTTSDAATSHLIPELNKPFWIDSLLTRPGLQNNPIDAGEAAAADDDKDSSLGPENAVGIAILFTTNSSSQKP